MNKRIVTSLFVIVLAAVLVGGGIMAWFFDALVVDGNEFTAGTLYLEVDASGLVDLGDIGNLQPGDDGEFTITVKNAGTLVGEWLSVLYYKDSVQLVGPGYGGSPLSEVLDVTIEVEEENWTWSGKLIDIGFAGQIGDWSGIGADEIRTINVSWAFPEEAGNEYQGSSVKVGFAVGLRQVDGQFGAFPYPEWVSVVTDDAELAAALADGDASVIVLDGNFNSFEVSRSNVAIYGINGATVFNNGSYMAINIKDNADGVVVSGLTFDGPNTVGINVLGSPVYLYNNTFIGSNMLAISLDLDTGIDGVIKGNVMDGVRKGISSIRNAPNQLLIEDNTFANVATQALQFNSAAGQSGKNVVVKNNTFINVTEKVSGNYTDADLDFTP